MFPLPWLPIATGTGSEPEATTSVRSATGRGTQSGPFIAARSTTGDDPVLLADLLGHASLDTLRIYTQPTDADREAALATLTADG